MSTTASLSTLRPRAADFLELTKPRITFTVATTALVGYLVAPGGRTSIGGALCAMAGTALVASSANAANMVIEWRRDALMQRTRARPIPAGRIARPAALWFVLALGVVGLSLLAWANTSLAAGVALATWAAYVLAYTPLKPVTSVATLVGGVPGALPPVIGWTAATGRLDPGAGVLFAILFLWQIPHFLAIAALYKDDYALAGLKVLPLEDPGGRVLSRQVLGHAAALVLVSLAPTFGGMAGPWYLGIAIVAGVTFLTLAARFARRLDRPSAQALFGASILYLLLLSAAMVLDRR